MERNEHYVLAGWLIDGSGTPVQKKMLLKIVDGSITDISRYNASDHPDSNQVRDLSHCCVLPPLIDAHAHLCMSGALDPGSREKQLTAEYKDLKRVIAVHLNHLFSHGILCVRDGGDRLNSVIRFHEEQSSSDIPSVMVKTPGRAYYREGRYGGLIGKAVPRSENLAQVIAREKFPGDHIKIVNSGLNSLERFAHQTDAQFSQQELNDTVAYGESKGLKVMVHANGIVPVRMAIEAGCHSVEHGFFMGEDNLERLAERQNFWVPTLYTMKGCLEGIELGIKDADQGVTARNLEHQLKQLAYARKCGVRVAVGTDAGCIGVLHGESMVDELKLFIKAGYSLPEAIQCATQYSAQLLGVDETFGRIGVGRPAHFLVTRGTPGQLPRKLGYLEAIYVGGRVSEDYRNMLKKARVHKL